MLWTGHAEGKEGQQIPELYGILEDTFVFSLTAPFFFLQISHIKSENVSYTHLEVFPEVLGEVLKTCHQKGRRHPQQLPVIFLGSFYLTSDTIAPRYDNRVCYSPLATVKKRAERSRDASLEPWHYELPNSTHQQIKAVEAGSTIWTALIFLGQQVNVAGSWRLGWTQQ